MDGAVVAKSGRVALTATRAGAAINAVRAATVAHAIRRSAGSSSARPTADRRSRKLNVGSSNLTGNGTALKAVSLCHAMHCAAMRESGIGLTTTATNRGMIAGPATVRTGATIARRSARNGGTTAATTG